MPSAIFICYRGKENKKAEEPAVIPLPFYIIEVMYYSTTDPKGANLSLATLKHCFPKGIPIMVTQRTAPTKMLTNARNPPRGIKQMLAMG